MKILIDHNLKTGVFRLLINNGFQAETASFNGLESLTNGKLSAKAFELGFQCILTQDRTFIVDAADVLATLPAFAIVLVDTRLLPQVPRHDYLLRFEKALESEEIVPKPGKIVHWPSRNWNLNS